MKLDPQQVSKKMRKETINGNPRFSPDEYMKSTQIASFFSRVAAEQRKVQASGGASSTSSTTGRGRGKGIRKEPGAARGRGRGRGRGTASRGRGKVGKQVGLECNPLDNDGDEEKEEEEEEEQDTCNVGAVQSDVICEIDNDYIDDVETFQSLQDEIHDHLVHSDIFDD